MKRFFIAFALSQIPLIFSAQAADLRGFIGKSVQDKVGGFQLFNVPDVKRNFISAFGSDRYDKISVQMQGGEIETTKDPDLGQLLVSNQCVPHDCPTQSTLIGLHPVPKTPS